ncbi:uncharacterized protein CcaverHIS019_0407450 [Cutaneotrichosporon cavernicola]|uniref:Calcium-transporting ATPase n=1 Tax=Cutaneotrichosporon cavernicola TaxID=279322 RepID=A0AA48L4R1_9TREE|nr:uncharacterized protein CcaverHIS019_0407450 [Cutaneotrichosporon cavernicola]BEI91925.1 hypothetical protein CcaverHIS019_0407450 [Cutaneotrichosporon cavernicola]BEI99696.1 hypothetical protein CcaverHIS631_0407390 [Cutaneotrichosporon cavernicola]BEJ07472.1 hypothetical protein CcaverHIS641_0407410 [Cutaneotrichosporon cavernicola]
MPPNPPPVIVTTDLDGPQPPSDAGTPGTPQRHRRSASQASDPTHLSPIGAHPAAALTPPSPTLTANSTSSVKVNDETGSPTSDGLEPISEHQRSVSNSTWSTNTEKPSFSPATTKLEDEAEDDKKKGKKNKAPPPMSHPDPENDTTDPTPFAEKPTRLAMLVDPKSLDDLEKIGGVDGLLNGLGVDPNVGLCTDGSNAGAPRSSSDMPGQGAQWRTSMEDRRRIYGPNDLPHRPSKTLLQLMWMAFKDKVIILLSVVAVISLALGLYSDLGGSHELVYSDDCPQGCYPPRVDWVEGVAIIVAVLIVVLVGSINDWQKERQFKELNDKREDRSMKVIRNGQEQVINVRDVVVGDIALVEPGEVVPVDGVFLRGHGVRCDESGATGESDAIKKSTYDECVAEKNNLAPGARGKLDCFVISGAKVLEGVGSYVVIAVGTTSFNGRIMMSMRTESEETPLQIKLNYLAELIAICGGAAGLILFGSLMIRFFVQLGTKPRDFWGTERDNLAQKKAQSFVEILIISITLVVVAVPEGLPLAVTLALAFATKRMTAQNLLVRVLGSCETMGHATVICTDKTGTLTQNVMTVVAGSLGVHGKFVRNLEDNQERSIAGLSEADRDDFGFDMEEMNGIASPELQTLFNEAICINSTAFEDTNPEGVKEFVGSKTETALLRFAQDLGWADYKDTRDHAGVVQMIPFSSELKAMGVVIKTPEGKYRIYVKGASEVLTKKCTSYVNVRAQPTPGVSVLPYDDAAAQNIAKTIIFYADQTLRTLALCYRDFEQWPPVGAEGMGPEDVPFELTSCNLTLIGVVGIEDPLRPGVQQAVAECQGASVAVKMCTGDNVLTARSISRQCGIFTPGGIIMEGPVFRKLSDADRLEVVPRLQILARSSPEDKKLLVKTLKSMGEVVGVTGDGTNDGPALKLANVGFAMGIAGTEVAKEASDIILMDDSFANIVVAIMWGRCVNDAVRKFLQFQISVNITAVVITFVSAVSSEEKRSVLTAVQLLWVNLIMDTFAALALATDPATHDSLKRKPDRKDAPLISVDMWKMIIAQASYQIAVCLILFFVGGKILNLPLTINGERSHHNEAELRSLVFNCFVFCQIFNQLNCRVLDRKYNVFKGFFRNIYFMAIMAIMIGGQILIVFVGGAAFQVQRLNGRDWGISLVVGFLSIPLGALVRTIPTAPIERLLVKWKLFPDPDQLPLVKPDEGEDEDDIKDAFIYNPALEKVKDNLSTYARFRGGRLSASSIVQRARHSALRKADIQLPSLLTMVPTLVGGSVGAGGTWVTMTQGHPSALANPTAHEASQSTTELYAGRVQLHPDTDPNDPMYAKFGLTPPARGEKA